MYVGPFEQLASLFKVATWWTRIQLAGFIRSAAEWNDEDDEEEEEDGRKEILAPGGWIHWLVVAVEREPASSIAFGFQRRTLFIW